LKGLSGVHFFQGYDPGSLIYEMPRPVTRSQLAGLEVHAQRAKELFQGGNVACFDLLQVTSLHTIPSLVGIASALIVVVVVVVVWVTCFDLLQVTLVHFKKTLITVVAYVKVAKEPVEAADGNLGTWFDLLEVPLCHHTAL
jgi:hypothetical protein